MPVHYVYLTISVLAEAVGFMALNASANFTRLWPTILVIAGFGGSFYFLTRTLDYMPVGVTYALASGLGVIVIAVAGLLVFGQRLDLAGAVGLALIAAGIVIINALSDFALH